jgi:hypothetical protein
MLSVNSLSALQGLPPVLASLGRGFGTSIHTASHWWKNVEQVSSVGSSKQYLSCQVALRPNQSRNSWQAGIRLGLLYDVLQSCCLSSSKPYAVVVKSNQACNCRSRPLLAWQRFVVHCSRAAAVASSPTDESATRLCANCIASAQSYPEPRRLFVHSQLQQMPWS